MATNKPTVSANPAKGNAETVKTQTSTETKPDETVKQNETGTQPADNQAETEKTEKTDTKPDETAGKDEKTGKSEKDKEGFDDDDTVIIVSKSRAGKSITANTTNIITFDKSGKAECSGFEAKYLLASGLDFELSK